MDGPERRCRAATTTVAGVALLAVLSWSCSQQPDAATSDEIATPQTTSRSAPTSTDVNVGDETAADTERDSPDSETSGSRGEVVVVEPGGAASDSATDLVRAAEAERQRRDRTAEATLVIDDSNLASHATGRLTHSDPGAKESSPAADAESDDGSTESTPRDEEYWRRGARSLRQRWSEAVDAIDTWEDRAAELRMRFYRTDDPYVRDGEIKPQWDRALERLATAKSAARAAETELRDFIEEGRRDGALPGWLREGTELEPDHFPYEGHREEDPLAREHEVLEPDELAPDDTGLEVVEE